MSAKLSGSERLIINKLIDTGMFTSNPIKPTNDMTEAVMSLKKTNVQSKIGTYLRNLIGVTPENIQENLLLVLSSEYEAPETVHVLLATLKAVINLPEMQGVREDRAVLISTIIRQVHSEVVDLDEKGIQRLITLLFVDRFKLFTLDYPELTQSEQNQEIDEYWNISPSFTLVAQAIVDQLKKQSEDTLNDIQRVNRSLLVNLYISPKQSPYLWQVLINNKNKIAEQWANLDRFDLECGDDYALLLDKKRNQVQSKPSVVAIDVAHNIHSGISESQLNQAIKDSIKKIFPNNTISLSSVKDSLKEFGIIRIRNEFIFPTPLVKRFSIKEETTEEAE